MNSIQWVEHNSGSLTYWDVDLTDVFEINFTLDLCVMKSTEAWEIYANISGAHLFAYTESPVNIYRLEQVQARAVYRLLHEIQQWSVRLSKRINGRENE